MTLVKCNPRRELFNFDREFNRFFRDFNRSFGMLRNEDDSSEVAEFNWSPLSDILENDDNFQIKLDLPGVDKKDVKISYSEGKIEISGERKNESKVEGEKYHRVERSHGKFFRSFNLPSEVKEDKIKADFKNGQLNVVIPKSEKAKPRMIDVKVN